MSRAFSVALLVALAIVALWWQLAERRARALDRELQRVSRMADSIMTARALSSDDSVNAAVKLRLRLTQQPDAPREIARLRQLGFEDPGRRIRESLLAHRELIPFKGVHGGTMHFDTSTVVLLEGGYAYAGFEDGHIGGRGIFAYDVAKGRITLNRLAAKLD